jgi:acyl carrier protein
MSDIVQIVRDFIVENYLPGEDPANLKATTPLISGAILDSLATLDLVTFLETQFGVTLAAHEVDREHLDTLERIAQLIREKQGSA